MTNELCFAATDLEQLRGALLPSEHGSCAVLFAAESHRSTGQVRLLVREIEHPTPSDYSSQGTDNAELSPAFVARVAKKARRNQLTLVFVHTHPGDKPPTFSAIDDHGEEILSEFLLRRGIEGGMRPS